MNLASSRLGACIACGADGSETLLDLGHIPVLCNDLHDSAESARSAGRGPMLIEFCRACGHFFNSAFDDTLIEYSSNYETALHHSAVFVDYVEELVSRLVNEWGVQGGHVLEVGCGRGEFLHALCRAGANRGSGFDTSWSPTMATDDPAPGVTIVPEYFDADRMLAPVDLIVSQQQLEHVDDPQDFLRGLFDHPACSGALAYIEVPNGRWTFESGGIWDLIFEHVSYFSYESLVRVVGAAGAEVLDGGESYGGQYLWVVARVGGAGGEPPAAPVNGFDFVDGFRARFEATLGEWRTRIEHEIDAGTTWLWGAGSKGITFANLVDPDGRLGGLVDRHPGKVGKFAAATGLAIVSPDDLVARAPSSIIVMNRLYRDEIAADLANLGLTPTIIDL